MYNGIGLATPRGSGTSGHVQRNLSYIKDVRGGPTDLRRQAAMGYEPEKYAQALAPRKANQDILLHERKRAIEVACAELELQLEDQDEPQDSIDAQVAALRTNLTKQLENDTQQAAAAAAKPAAHMSSHERAVAKHQENQRFASALRLEPSKHVPGQAFDRDAMAKRKEEELAERDRKRAQREQERLAVVLAVIVDEVHSGIRPPADLQKAEKELGFTWDEVKASVPVRMLPASLRPPPPAPRGRDDRGRGRSYSRSRSRSPPPRRDRYAYRRSPSYSRSRSPPRARHMARRGSDVEMGEIVSPPRRWSRSRSPPPRGRRHDRRSLSRSVSRSRSRSRDHPRAVLRSRSPSPRSPRKSPQGLEDEVRGRSLERRPRRLSRSGSRSRSMSRSLSRSLSRSPSPAP